MSKGKKGRSTTTSSEIEIDEGSLITQDQLNEIISDTRKQVTLEIRSLIQTELKSMRLLTKNTS